MTKATNPFEGLPQRFDENVRTISFVDEYLTPAEAEQLDAMLRDHSEEAQTRSLLGHQVVGHEVF